MQIKYGHNLENDLLPQLNLALLFGYKSNLPFYYRKLAGNTLDVKAFKNIPADLDFLDLDKVYLVMDRSFYSAETINDLYREHNKFLIGARTLLKFV